MTPTPPPAPVMAAPSYYVGDLDPGRLMQLGSRDRTAAVAGGMQRAVVVLDFGDPDTEPGATQLPDRRGSATPTQIQLASQAYAKGWGSGSQLTLVVATSNFGSHVDADHGTAWAQLVDAIAVDSPGVDVRGGFDGEPSYNGPRPTLAFAQAYLRGGMRPFVDLGDCPCTPGQALPNGWSLHQRGQLALAGSVLPQIYRTSGIDATRWAHLDQSVAPKKLDFLGVLTEVGACVGPPRRDCAGIDLAPSAATASMSKALGRAVTASTDISYLAPPTPEPPPRSHHVRDGLIAGGVGLIAVFTVVAMLLSRRRRRH